MATPHIMAKKGEIAQSVILPGDPRRAKYIADNFLSDAVLFNDVRGILGFTGCFNGKRVSVMGSGMGIPSVSIYANELFMEYDVQNIIRVGTCGTAQTDIGLGDVILAQGCSTDSDINRRVFGGTFCPIADFQMLRTAYQKAVKLGKNVRVGNMLSSDMFYSMADAQNDDLWWKYGVLGVEMEGAGLYTAAARHKRRALMICTVSDTFEDRTGMSPEQREKSLNDMIELALNTIIEFGD